MHDCMPYGRNQGQGQGHSREVDRQSPTGLIFMYLFLAKHNLLMVRYSLFVLKMLLSTNQPTSIKCV